jgi:prophage regulatory protein
MLKKNMYRDSEPDLTRDNLAIREKLEAAVPAFVEIIQAAKQLEHATDVADQLFNRLEILTDRLEKLEANVDRREVLANHPVPRNKRLMMAKEVIKMTGLNKSTFYELIKRGEFPQGVNIGNSYRRWRFCDVEDWLANRPTVEEA